MNLDERIEELEEERWVEGEVPHKLSDRQLKQLIRKCLEYVKPERHQFKHKHDIQVEDGRYRCLQCRKLVDDIVGDDGLGLCPHSGSFNEAIAVMERKIKELGLELN